MSLSAVFFTVSTSYSTRRGFSCFTRCADIGRCVLPSRGLLSCKTQLDIARRWQCFQSCNGPLVRSEGLIVLMRASMNKQCLECLLGANALLSVLLAPQKESALESVMSAAFTDTTLTWLACPVELKLHSSGQVLQHCKQAQRGFQVILACCFSSASLLTSRTQSGEIHGEASLPVLISSRCKSTCITCCKQSCS